MSLTPVQEWLIVELRKTLLLSNEDLLGVTQEFISPYLTLPTLHRCLEKYGVETVETLQTELGLKITDKEPGLVRLVVKTLPLMPNETQNKFLFVAIDQASHWVFHKVSNNNCSCSQSSFLMALLKAAPFRIHTLFTNSPDEFSDQLPIIDKLDTTKEKLSLNQICIKENIQHHRLKSILQTSETEERFKDIKRELKNQQPDCWREWGPMFSRYVTIYNQLVPQKSLSNLTPLRKLKELYSNFPKNFKNKKEPKTLPIACTYPFSDLMHALCDVFDLYSDEMKHQGEKKLRMKELKEKQSIQLRHVFFLKHFDIIINALSSQDETNRKARERRLQAYAQLCLDITNISPFSFNSRQATLRNFFRNALIPVMAIEVFTDTSIDDELSIYHHLHEFIRCGFIEEHNSIYTASRKFLRQYIKNLAFTSSDITAEFNTIINRLSPRQGQGISSLRAAYETGRQINSKLSTEKYTIKENENKLLKLQQAYHAILLILYLERHTSMGMEFINYYNMLVAKRDCTQPLLRKLITLYRHLESNWREDDEYNADYHWLNVQQRNAERYYQPIVDTLLWNTINDDEMPFEKFPIGSIFILRDLVSLLISDINFSHLTFDSLDYIADIRGLSWSHRIMAKPYNCIINIIQCIKNNDLKTAFELTSDAPYHEDDVFGFHLAFFSIIYIGLRVKLRKENKISYHGLSAHVTNATMYHGFAANIRGYASDVTDNPMIDSLYNVTIMRSICFYNRLIMLLANGGTASNTERPPQSIDGILDVFELSVGNFLNALSEYGKDISVLDDADLANLRQQFDTDYYRSNLISFLDDSNLKNCILDFRAIVKCMGNIWEMERMPNIQTLVEHESNGYISLFCSILPSTDKSDEKMTYTAH